MAAATAWYREGTIAVTNGTKAVAGTGTSWLSQILPADLLFITDANGNLTAGPYEVETVTSDTALALKAVFPGTTASAAKYCVIRHFNNTLPADLSSRLSKLIAGYQVTVDQFITFLTSSGTVTLTGLDGTTYSVQGLLGFANQVPDHNASTAAHGMTTTGRALLQSTDAAAARSTLGLEGHQFITVTAAGRVQINTTDDGVSMFQVGGSVRVAGSLSIAAAGSESVVKNKQFFFGSGATRTASFSGAFNYVVEVTATLIGNSGSSIAQVKVIAGRRDWSGASHYSSVQKTVGTDAQATVSYSDSGDTRNWSVTFSHATGGGNLHWMIETKTVGSEVSMG